MYLKIKDNLKANLAYFVTRLESKGSNQQQYDMLLHLLKFVLIFNGIYGLDFYSDM